MLVGFGVLIQPQGEWVHWAACFGMVCQCFPRTRFFRGSPMWQTAKTGRWFSGVLILVVSLCARAAAEGLPSRVEGPSVHPLATTIQFAETRLAYIREHVRTYRCQLVKRERMGGRMQAYQYADVMVQCSHGEVGETQQPMSVFMRFLGPAKMKGRIVLFTEGQDDNLAWVRMGGSGLFKDVELKIDPHGDAAKRESRYPINQIGFDQIMERLIDLANADLKADPQGKNTVVTYFRNAKLKDRSCTHIEVVHPQRAESLAFHKASLYVDDELNVPVRLVVYDWPASPDAGPKLVEEYNYVNLQLNVTLPHDVFHKAKYFNEK